MTSKIDTNISLNEIKDMYYNVFKKKPRGRYANDKLKLLEKINKEVSNNKTKSKNKNIVTESSIKNQLEVSNDELKFMDDIDIDIDLISSNKSYKNKNKTEHKYDYCKKFKNVEEVDLNKIELTKIDDDIKCKKHSKNDYFDSTKTYKITYNKKIDLCNIKYINEGTYGTVFMYSNKKGNYKVAVKNYFESDDDEINIYKLLIKKGIDCNIVNIKVIEYRSFFSKYYVGIMDYMHGSLSDLNGKLTKGIFLKVIKDISLALKCLKDKDMAYTDLKTSNILYKCTSGKIKITLGDIGSICRAGDYNSCTWLPIEYYKTGGFPKCNESSMVWGLGVIILELLNFKVDYFHFSNIENFKEDDIKNSHIYIYKKYYIPIMTKYLDYFKFKKNTLKVHDIIFGIFSKTRERLTLDDIINAIK
tara:strand:- start:1099 stop:2349 length:1251 start_codon:yes stop_codon:yes gene_type:complete